MVIYHHIMKPVFKGFWCVLIFCDGITGTVTRLFALDPICLLCFSLLGCQVHMEKQNCHFLECQEMQYGHRCTDPDGSHLFGQVFDN